MMSHMHDENLKRARCCNNFDHTGILAAHIKAAGGELSLDKKIL